jgi:hypothetical protein
VILACGISAAAAVDSEAIESRICTLHLVWNQDRLSGLGAMPHCRAANFRSRLLRDCAGNYGTRLVTDGDAGASEDSAYASLPLTFLSSVQGQLSSRNAMPEQALTSRGIFELFSALPQATATLKSSHTTLT